MTRALLYCAGGGIGDSLVASVVAHALRSKYETIDALTLPGHRETLERVPDFYDVLIDNGGDEAALADDLARRNYDACVVTWATPRTARIPQLATIPVRVGQARRLYSFRFNRRVVVRSERGDVTSHWSDILLDYARELGCDAAGYTPRFVPTDDDFRDADHALTVRHLGIGDFIVLHPTNAIAPKRTIWPTGGWIKLATALRERFAIPVVLTGTREDREINDAIANGSGAISLAGAFGIGAFGALVARARAFVGITTGSMHVAAAVGAPTVGIFPFQSDFPERWAPLGPLTAVVRASYPCHAGDTKERCPDYACIANLDVPRVVATTENLLSRG